MALANPGVALQLLRLRRAGVKHHVKEEHTEMFPKAKASSLDMIDLGARMAARKDELLAHS